MAEQIALFAVYILALFLWLSCAPYCATLAEPRRGPVWFAALIGLLLGPFGVYLIKVGLSARTDSARSDHAH